MPLILTTFLAAAAADSPASEPSGSEINVQTALLLVILVCLAFMAKSLARLHRRVHLLTEAKGRADARVVATQADPPSSETTALIAAAVYAVLERPARIISVDETAVAQARDWSLEGRRQIFGSHHVR